MIPALLILAAWQTAVLLILLAGARLGVVRLSITRPAQRKNGGTA